ncbi:hypothetical protein [Halorhabdus amylolytica]|uniref:hypothetical protein n=1 Tax=Halorhabdus amylolytica TaxID=2559573 RepID=UPI0010AA56BA|nr:hypothetical protein [Halorhabdus amylolytica]
MSGDDPNREEESDGENDSRIDEKAEAFEVIEEPETGDPFDGIDVEDRDADPFERLGDRDTPPEADPSDTSPEPFEAGGSDAEPGPESSPEKGESETGIQGTPTVDDPADDPFSEMGRNERAGDPFEGLTGGSVRDGEAARPDSDLWEELSRSEVEPETERHGQRRFAEVSKHTYCERCEHFSEPPEIACAHEGTDIIEFVDFETVRVADCPIVAEREQLADMDRER